MPAYDPIPALPAGVNYQAGEAVSNSLSPIVSLMLRLKAQKMQQDQQQLENDRQARMDEINLGDREEGIKRQSLQDALTEMTIRQRMAAMTPENQAPTVDISSQPPPTEMDRTGTPGLSPEEAAYIKPTTQVPRTMQSGGPLGMSYPLKYAGQVAEEAQQAKEQALKDESAKAVAGGHAVRLSEPISGIEGDVVPASIFTQSQKPDAPPKTENIGGRVKGWNPQTQRFDIDYGQAGKTGPNDSSSITGNFGLQGEDFLKTLPPQDQQLVKKVANYELDLTRVSSIRGDQRKKLAAAVSQYDPSFDMSQYASRAQLRKEFTSGQSARNLTALDTAERHLQTLENASKKLPRHDFQILNTLQNFSTKQGGSPAVTNVENARSKVADEVNRAFVGAGAQAQAGIKRELDSLNPNMSDAQWNGAISTIREMLAGRRAELRAQYERGMGKPANLGGSIVGETQPQPASGDGSAEHPYVF